jgi:hypothetical protein
VLDFEASSITRRRVSHCHDVAEKLFAMITLGDDRSITETRVMATLVS